VTKPKDYVVKPTHGILLPRQVLRVASTSPCLSVEMASVTHAHTTTCM
jgi:hypothetical protein